MIYEGCNSIIILQLNLIVNYLSILFKLIFQSFNWK